MGFHSWNKPQIAELPLETGTSVVVYTDGLEMAGARSERVFDVPAAVRALVVERRSAARALADALLERALELDGGRPRDDISVLALTANDDGADGMRRLAVRLPL